MAGFTAPGIFFLATVARDQQLFLRSLFEHARLAGYSRFVEPAAGAFAMSVLAKQAGWTGEQLDTSDVALISAVLGYAATGQDLGALQVQFHAEELADLDPTNPAHILYAQLFSRYLLKARKHYYWQQIILDLTSRRAESIAELEEHVGELAKALAGMRYRTLDMFDHLAEVLNDPRAIISLNPPTITKGFEKFFDTGGLLTWQEPSYGFFDPKTGLQTIAEQSRDAKALIILYEQQGFGESVLPPVFSIGTALKSKTDTGGVRTGNVYLTSNRPDEVADIMKRGCVSRKSGIEIGPSQFPILPDQFEPTDQTTITLTSLDEGHALYYRALWTHRFVGSSGSRCLAVLLDGYVAGIFAYNTEWLRLGKFGEADPEATASVFLQYVMTPRLAGWRVNRLIVKVALARETIAWSVDAFSLVRVKWLITANFSRMPEAKEMRGLMTLQGRTAIKGKFGLGDGYQLRYRQRVELTTLPEAYAWWLAAERKYRAVKAKSSEKEPLCP